MSVIQNLTVLYSAYADADVYVSHCRTKSALYRHLFSLPARLKRRIYAARILRAASLMKKFPPTDPSSKMVVSLTSFPARINSLDMVLKSILLQTIRPCQIVVYLSVEEFPNQLLDLPLNLREFINDNSIKVRFVPQNIRSHKKYYYAFGSFKDKVIITFDDDLFYAPDTIERLLNLHLQFPTSVCANVVRNMGSGDLPYKQWEKVVQQQPAESDRFVAIGYGGVLYPEDCLAKSSVLNVELAHRLSPLAHDLWLKANELVSEVRVASGGQPFAHPITIPNSQRVSLQSRNMSSVNMNDVQWKQLKAFFDIGVH